MPHQLASESGAAASLPLAGLRVIELADGRLETCARLLADLGADVILVEPSAGAACRQSPPMAAGASLSFAVNHANKRSVVLDIDTADGYAQLARLADSADMLIETVRPRANGEPPSIGQKLRLSRPGLVVLSISDFGQTGPYRDYAGSHAVHMATSGVLCRSGLPGREPLLPPGALGWESAAIQAAWVALLAQWQRLQTGHGEFIDFSINEGIAQVLDPALGVTGSAAAGKSALDSTHRGRPKAVPLYPVIPCKDGHVRICVLNPRQWEAMSAWLGSDHAFTDPIYGNIAKRMAVADKINVLIEQLFQDHGTQELVAQGQGRGVPIAAIATPGQVLQDQHFAARGAFAPIQIAPGVQGQVPSGYLEIDGARAGMRTPAPALGQHTDEVLGGLARRAPRAHAAPPDASFKRAPLHGLRVLDLGVIVAGAEAGRLMADQGAEVIKIENRAFPDGGRQSMNGAPMTASIAQGHRNKLSMGINLRSDKGRELFKQLAAKSDVVLSNFKPGTLESLGLGYDVLSRINPRIIMMDSSALGRTGPQSRSMGYGPLVRAATGLSWLWQYPDAGGTFCDGATIYPDHIAARVAVAGVMSLLIRRERTGTGGAVSLSQAEIFLNSSAEHFLRESLQPGSVKPASNAAQFHAPEGVYACSGDDEWCALAVQNDAHWALLLQAIGREDLLEDRQLASEDGRIARRGDVDAAVSAWTAQRSPREASQLLQAAGVPCGAMLRLSEYKGDAQFQARRFIRTLEHPGLPDPLPTENAPALTLHMPEPALRPAPYQGEHTRELAARLLNLSGTEIDALLATGDLEMTV